MNSVFATYEDISDCWPVFKHNIEGFFPLRNVHKHKPAVALDVNTLIRNIPIINIKFVPLKAELLAHKSILNLNERPYLHIFIGFCEDIDSYRQLFRPKLKSWLEAVSIRKAHQYIVILIEDQSIAHENSKSSKTFLLDKIRFDFNDKVSFKLISLKLMPGEILSTIPECVNIISDSIYHSTIMNLNQLDEDIRKLASQQNSPGWNFFNFFLIKESKAMTLLDLGLFSEALACYDELETLFLDIVLTDYASKFECIIPSGLTISGSDLNSTNWIKFREMIHHNRISFYEFRVYLLSRQIHILKELNDQMQILSRCKEFVCQSLFIEKIDHNTKSEWVFSVIFFVLKVIDFDSIRSDHRQDLSNILAEVLIIAISQITLNIEDVNGDDNLIENLSEISQIVNLSYPLTIDQLKHFKISALRYCYSILKNTTYSHKQLMISLKLSHLYFQLKMFDTALAVLQETSDQILVKKWPLIQIVLMEKTCDCYWNLNMRREYLRNFFDIILIKGTQKIIDVNESDKINEAVFSLDDILIFNYENFFSINELSSTDSSKDDIFLKITISSKFKLPFKQYQIELTLSGESEDVIFSSDTTTTILEDNIITSKLLSKNEYTEGIYKIKNIRIIVGKVEFKSEKGSDIWNKDLNLLTINYLHLEAIVPKNFNFSKPYIIIRCQNLGAFDVENLTLEIAPSDLNLTLGPEKLFESDGKKSICSDIIASKSHIDIQYIINNYICGRQNVKIISTHDCNDIIRLKTNHFIEIDMPKPWNVKKFDFNYGIEDIFCFEISPEMNSENIKLLRFGTEGSNHLSDFNFEVDKYSSNINISSRSINEKNDFNVAFLKNGVEHSVTIPVGKLRSNIISCICVPVLEKTDIRIGDPITFKITILNYDKPQKLPFFICCDNNHWLLSGASSGYIQESGYFEAVPIRSGLLQLPAIVLLTPVPIRMITAGSTIFVTV